MSTDDSKFLYELQVEVQSELDLAESSNPNLFGSSPDEWLSDPTDLEREEVGLRNMLGAVQAMEGDA